jgi:molybdenum cofactor guanylyltransferase
MGCTISGVILAGGDSKRFGGITKSNIVIGGERIISRIINSIGTIFDEIIIVTNNPSEFPQYTKCRFVGDKYLKAGPLGGIHAALRSTAADAIFVFAGDMPFLRKEIITEQINQFCLSDYDILIPIIGEFIEPLHSIYRVAVLDDLEKFLSQGKNRSVRDFIVFFHTGYMRLEESEENKRAFTNINTRSDISELF